MTNLEIAVWDLKSAKLLLTTSNDEGALRIVAYHCQQALEKTLKHIIETGGVIPPLIHDIDILTTMVVNSGFSVLPVSLMPYVLVLTNWEASSRYKGSFRVNVTLLKSILKEIQSYHKEVSKVYGKAYTY